MLKIDNPNSFYLSPSQNSEHENVVIWNIQDKTMVRYYKTSQTIFRGVIYPCQLSREAWQFNPGPGGYSKKNWVGVCGPLPKTLTLFMTKICDFPYPIYD